MLRKYLSKFDVTEKAVKTEHGKQLAQKPTQTVRRLCAVRRSERRPAYQI